MFLYKNPNFIPGEAVGTYFLYGKYFLQNYSFGKIIDEFEQIRFLRSEIATDGTSESTDLEIYNLILYISTEFCSKNNILGS